MSQAQSTDHRLTWLAAIICIVLVVPGIFVGAVFRVGMEYIQISVDAQTGDTIFGSNDLKFLLTFGFRKLLQGMIAGAFAILVTTFLFGRANGAAIAYSTMVVWTIAILGVVLSFTGSQPLDILPVIQLVGICIGLHTFRHGI